jgi:hypothetical protein
MKSLIKFNRTATGTIKDFFILKHQYSIGKDLITVGGDSDKYAIIDSELKNISLFNKVNQEKIRAVKIDIYTISITNAFLKFFYDFINNNENFNISLTNDGEISIINILSYSTTALKIKNVYNLENWHRLKICDYQINEDICVPTDKAPKIPDDVKLNGLCALAIMELNYSFCEPNSLYSRDMFADIRIYTSKMLSEFIFASPSTLIKHFINDNLSNAILQELINPAFDKTIKKLKKENDSLAIIGILAENGNTVWIPMATMLEYMDMTEEIFYICLDNIKDKEIVTSYSIFGLENFPTTEVKYMKIYLEKSNYLYNFANILNFKDPCYNEDTKKYEQLEDYGLDF